MTKKSNTDHPTILVAEDSELVRSLASDVLVEHGYTVVEADNAAEALKVMEKRSDIQLLFTDIEMPPGLNGLELAREVYSRWPKVHLVITSGRIMPTRAEIADHGRFLQKPYQAKTLLDQIDGLIKHGPNNNSPQK